LRFRLQAAPLSIDFQHRIDLPNQFLIPRRKALPKMVGILANETNIEHIV